MLERNTMKNDMHDWASCLIKVETNLKALEYRLLHKQYEGADQDVLNIMHNLSKTLVWIEDEQQLNR